MVEAKGVEAVDRALKVLECCDGRTQEITLAELSRQTEFYKSTILRLTVSLERFGYLVRGESGRFRLGPAAWRLGSCYRQGFDLSHVLRPELKALCEKTNETASFYIREGDNRICLYRVEPSRSIRHSIVEGASMPLKKGASGKILSAFSGEPTKQFAEVKVRGYAISLGERDPEVAAVAVPLFSKSGRIVGALSVSGLITRFEEHIHEKFITALKASSQRLSDQIST